jgi:hypothetical protein
MGEKIMFQYSGGSSGNVVTLADSNTVDSFETVEGYLDDLSETCDLLQQLGADTEKLKGVVAGWALRKAGLD